MAIGFRVMEVPKEAGESSKKKIDDLYQRSGIVAIFDEGGDAGDNVGFVFRVGDPEP